MHIKNTAIVATVATIFTAGAVSASTLGTPLFTTAPGSINIVNEFGPDLLPTPSYSISMSSTVASTIGLPEMVGATVEFNMFVNNGFAVTEFGSLRINGIEIILDAALPGQEFLAGPPFTEAVFGTFDYTGIFAGFGPRTADFPEFLMGFALNDPIPTRTGYESCTAAFDCEFSSLGPLTEVGGNPVVDVFEYVYPEGTIENGTITFFTVGGPPPAEVPLPAGGLLLLSALGTGVLMRRKRG